MTAEPQHRYLYVRWESDPDGPVTLLDVDSGGSDRRGTVLVPAGHGTDREGRPNHRGGTMSTNTTPVAAMTKGEARRLTRRIATAVEHAWQLVAEAYEREAWRPLGYDSFEAYVNAEFEMSRGQAYRLINQASVVRELEAAANLPVGGLSRARDTTPSARQAATIGPNISTVAEDVAAATRGQRQEKRPGIVAEVVKKAAAGEPKPAPAKKVPESTIPTQPKPARPKQPAAASITEAVTALLAYDGGDARSLDALLFARLQSWLRQAEEARKPQRGRPAPKPAETRQGDCPHPPGRRLADTCMECGATVKGRR